MAKIRVLVIEDSLTVRRRIVEVLAADPDLTVVGEAADGRTGTAMCQDLRPDIVTLDLMLPGMNGLEATERIMAYCPTPILVVSAATNRGALFDTYDALAAGALDVLEKPTGDEQSEEWERRLVATVKLLARIKVITHVRGRHARTASSLAPHDPRSLRAVAIGASTGGPAALVELLGGLSDFPLPILIVLHLGRAFAPAFAEWLAGQLPLRVAYARDGDVLPPPGAGQVVLAPPDHHLVLRGDRLRLTDDPLRHFCRPSVDVLFESVADELASTCAACLLTGMGKDGAEGLLRVRQRGGRTVAQDEATSSVFGMPKEAILLGAAEHVLPIDRIASHLTTLVQPRRSS